MLTGWTRLRIPSRVPLSIRLRSCLDGEPFDWRRQAVLLTQVVNADAQKPDRTSPGLGLVDQLYCARGDLCGISSRRCRVASGDSREVRRSDLNGDGPSQQHLAFEPARR